MAREVQGYDVLTDELGWLIARSRRLLFRHANERLERVGASMFMWPLLRRVVQQGALSQLELARQTAQHPAAVCRSLEELERRRLVRRGRGGAADAVAGGAYPAARPAPEAGLRGGRRAGAVGRALDGRFP
jgi:hypothetical protein